MGKNMSYAAIRSYAHAPTRWKAIRVRRSTLRYTLSSEAGRRSYAQTVLQAAGLAMPCTARRWRQCQYASVTQETMSSSPE
jgi:hypothetical protein